jgi:hypothetical protein
MGYNVWETCLFVPDFSRVECASWVQAWGSIIAIGGAFAIAYFQARHLQKLEAVRQDAERREMCVTVAEQLRNFQAFCRALVKRLPNNGQAVEVGRNFKQGAPVFCGINTMALPSALASRVAGLQYAAMITVTRVDGGDLSELRKNLQQLADDCETAIQRSHELAAGLPQRGS